MTPNKIILVDDDSDDRYFMKMAIEARGSSVEIIELESVNQLLSHLEEKVAETALIILDVNMPVISGIEGVPLIRSVEGAAAIPIAMVSTSPGPELRTRAFASGVSSFDPKPNSLSEFSILMGRLMDKHILQPHE